MATNMNIGLKQYLMQDFPDSKYKNTSLIRLYELDNEYYKALVKKGKVSPEAITFFATKSKDVKQIGRGNIEALKSMGYESLINQYLEECAATERRKEEKVRQKEEERLRKEEEGKAQELAKKQQAAKEKKERKKKLIQEAVKTAAPKIIEARKEEHRPQDVIKWQQKEKEKEERKKRSVQEAAMKRAKFEEALRKKEEKEALEMEKRKKSFLKKQAKIRASYETSDARAVREFSRSSKNSSSSAHVIQPKKIVCTIYGAPTPITCPTCRKLLTKTGKAAFKCPNCRRIYISCNRYEKNKDQYDPINKNDIERIREQIVRYKEEVKKETEKKAAEEKKIKEWRAAHQEEIRKRETVNKKIKQIYLSDLDFEITDLAEQESVLQFSKPDQKAEEAHIAVRDFVIRRTVFQCKSSGHKLRNIIGLVYILNKYSNKEEVSFPAGYCPICDKYFVMESTYKSIKRRGRLLCRVTDEKNYLNGDNGWMDTSGMAQESILKQYGYSVAANSGVSEKMRRAILEAIIDEGELSFDDVLSYLNMFINLKFGQDQYGSAISKWQSDIKYLNDKYANTYWNKYRANSFTR